MPNDPAISEPTVQLDGVSDATDQMRGIAKQALEWVRVSEERVAKAEARAASVDAEVKDRAKAALRKIGEEGRTRIAGERQRRVEAESRAKRAEQALQRAEKGFEQARQRDHLDRENVAAELIAHKERAEEERIKAVKQAGVDAEKKTREAIAEMQSAADSRLAAAEQRAAEAEAAAEEARAIAVKIESEIEERVMQGTEEVRREAEDRVRQLIEKFEGEAENIARARARDQLEAESDRIRKQAEQREERARSAAEDEIKASVGKARRQARAAADATAPSWGAQDETDSTVSGYRTF